MEAAAWNRLTIRRSHLIRILSTIDPETHFGRGSPRPPCVRVVAPQDGIFIGGAPFARHHGAGPRRNHRRIRPWRRLRFGTGASPVSRHPARSPERSAAGRDARGRPGGFSAAPWEGSPDSAPQTEPSREPLGSEGGRGNVCDRYLVDRIPEEGDPPRELCCAR